jgi:hypothetical protein
MFSFCTLKSSAQLFPSYCVYTVVGNGFVLTPDPKIRKLVQSQLLFEKDTLLLKTGCEISLINKDGLFISVGVPGKYTVRELRNRIRVQAAHALTASYLKLVYEQTINPDYDEAKNKKNTVGAAYGGAIRGSACLIYPGQCLKTSEDSLRFIWHSSKDSGKFIMTIFDSSNNAIYSAEVNRTTQVTNIKNIVQNKPGRYYWKVDGLDISCSGTEPQSFEFLSREQEDKELSLTRYQNPGKRLLDQLDAIDRMESNCFIEKAKRNYSELVNMNNKNTALGKSYGFFLMRHGLQR